MYKTTEELNFLLNKEFLLKEYLEKKRSRLNIAQEIGCDESTVKNRLVKYNIPVRVMKEAYSLEIRKRMSLAKKGKNNPNWKGGISQLVSLIYNSFEAREWRKSILKRDKYICKECGKKGGNLEVHHIKEFVKLFKEFLQLHNYLDPIKDKLQLLELAKSYKPFWDLNNGKTLCYNCHNIVEDKK